MKGTNTRRKLTQKDIPICKCCGEELGVFIDEYTIICSSSYIDGPLCYECQVEHCLTTNCLSCEMGSYPNCEHLERKKYYMTADKVDLCDIICG